MFYQSYYFGYVTHLRVKNAVYLTPDEHNGKKMKKNIATPSAQIN